MFPRYGEVLVTFSLSTAGCFFNAFVRSEPLNDALWNLASKVYHPDSFKTLALYKSCTYLLTYLLTSMVWCKAYTSI